MEGIEGGEGKQRGDQDEGSPRRTTRDLNRAGASAAGTRSDGQSFSGDVDARGGALFSRNVYRLTRRDPRQMARQAGRK